MSKLRTARHHSMQYYLALPRGWRPDKRWPIVVTVDGSDHAYRILSQFFIWARGNRPFILVTPLVLTNSGRPNPKDYPYAKDVWDEVAQTGPFAFDEQGLLAVVSDVQAEYGGADKFFITGYSAGGHLAWATVFAHPDRLAGAALACGNYLGRGFSAVSTAPERVTLPIRGFQGGRDKRLAALDEQWQAAIHLAETHGYQEVSRQIVPGSGHSPFPSQVLGFFESLLPR